RSSRGCCSAVRRIRRRWRRRRCLHRACWSDAWNEAGMHDDDGTRPLKIIAIGAVALRIGFARLVGWLPVGDPNPPTAQALAAAKTDLAPTSKRFRPSPKWIWGKAREMACTLRSAFEAPHGAKAELRIACDNHGVVFVNDKRVAANDNWRGATTIDVTSALR